MLTERHWSDWVDAQADLSLCWAQNLCWFCHVAAQKVIEFLLWNVQHSFLWQRCTCKLEHPSPYELVPNISQYKSVICISIWSDAAPIAQWLRTLIFSTLNCSSSHCCGFEPSSGHVRQAKFWLWVVRWFFLRISYFWYQMEQKLGSKWGLNICGSRFPSTLFFLLYPRTIICSWR